VFAAALFFASTAHAQSGASNSDPEVVTPLPETLNEAAIRAVISELDDRQVRALLLERLSIEAERQAQANATANNVGFGDVVVGGAAALGAFLADVMIKAPRIPGEIEEAFITFAEQRGDVDLWRFFVTLAASLGLGAFAAFTVSRFIPAMRADPPIRDDKPISRHAELLRHAGVLALRFALQAIVVAVFALCALAVNAWINVDVAADQDTGARIVKAIAWPWFTLVVARFLLAPQRPDLRLCSINDAQARWLTLRLVLVSTIFYAGFGFTRWLNDFGSVYRDSWHGFWVNLAVHVALALTFWQGRFILRKILRGDAADDPAVPEPRLHRSWPAIAVGLVALHWLVIEIIVANAYVPDGLLFSMGTTLLLLMALPFLDQALGAVVAAVFAGDSMTSPVLKAANEQTQRGTLRIARVVGGFLLLFGILAVWGVDLVTVAERGIGARFGSHLVGALLIAGVAYIVSEAIRVIIDRQIAMERVTLGLDAKEDGPGEGEGGGAGARLGTLLPLVRVSISVAIIVLAVLTILGQFGVNVLPLLAGAGVVGLAIGFGAQTLVKDIVSGIFFLIDDAFRIGEYIDVGTVRGTVERISVRSMQLRHHRGVLNTVPFGDIGHVANFSRDWVIMKFPLRLPYGTDTEKVRKMIKKLGQQLLDHPEFGDQFLQPLKSQGVVQMEDSAMIVPVKFMARPGDQWMLRRLVLTRIHELFEEQGIRFASREVTVRLGDDQQTNALDAADREAIAGAAGRLLHDEARDQKISQPTGKS
jgi:small-conductance mechanosensitive channel